MHTNSTSMPRARLSALVAMCAVGVALVAADSAHAMPKQGSGSAGCAVENENGAVAYVNTGTRIGLFVCGSDGDWHFGWLVNP